MKVLVTGATGYLGRLLIERLKREDAEIIAVARHGSHIAHLKNGNIKIAICDLSNANSAKSALSFIKDLDAVYHLAAATSGSHYESMMNSVIATENLFNALSDTRVKRFILVSTFCVYKMTAIPKGGALDEDSPLEDRLKLRDSYTITKIRQERLCINICKRLGIPLVIMRPGKIYGPGVQSIPPQLGLRFPGLFFLYMGGGHIIPLTHVENCAEAVYLAGVSSEPSGPADVYNIVDDDLPTQRRFLKLYRRYGGRVQRLVWVPDFVFSWMVKIMEKASKVSKGNIPRVITRYRADNLWKPLRYGNSRAKTRLGWRPRITVEDGIRATLQQEKNRERKHEG